MVYTHEQTKPNKPNQHLQLEASVKKENIITNCITTVLKIINTFIIIPKLIVNYSCIHLFSINILEYLRHELR